MIEDLQLSVLTADRGAGGMDVLEADVGVDDKEGTESSVHDGVEGAGGERSDGQRDQTGGDDAGIISG